MQRNDVGVLVELGLGGCRGVAVGGGARTGRVACPDQDLHAEGAAVAGDYAADAAVAVNAERVAAQRVANADLPLAGLQRRHLLRDLPHRGEDQAERELGGGVGRGVRVLAGGDDDAEARAGLDVDVRVDAALGDQPQVGQAVEQGRADLGAFADQHQGLGVAQARRQGVGVLDVVGVDGDVLAGEFREAGQRADGVVVVVEDGDVHGVSPWAEGGRVAAHTASDASLRHARTPMSYQVLKGVTDQCRLVLWPANAGHLRRCCRQQGSRGWPAFAGHDTGGAGISRPGPGIVHTSFVKLR